MNRVYDEKENQKYERTMSDLKKAERESDPMVHPDGSHDDVGGLQPHKTATLDQMEAGLKNNEKGSHAEQKEQNQLSEKEDEEEESGGWNTNLDKGKKRFKISARGLAIGGGATGLAVGSTMGFLTFLSGPLQFIHLAQMFQNFHFSSNEDAGNSRSTRFIRHLLKKTPQDGRLGYVATKYAKRFEARMVDTSGIRPVYNSNGRFVGYEIVDEDKAKRFLADAESDKIPIDDKAPGGVTTPDGSTPEGKFVNLTGDGFGKRRSMIRLGVKSTGVNKISGSVTARVLIKRAGVDFHPLNFTRRAADKIADFRTSERKKRTDADRDGTTDPDGKPVYTDPDEDDGKDLSDDQKAANDAGDEAVKDAKSPDGKVKVGAKLTAGAAAIVGVLCTVRDLSDNVGDLQNTNIVLPLTRVGTRFVAIGNQVMYGEDFSLDQLGALNADLNDPELGSWMEAKSIQAELGRTHDGKIPGKDIPPQAKPGAEKPALLQIIDNLFSSIGVVGDAICNPVTQLALNVTNLTPAGILSAAAGFAASAAGVNPMDMLTEWITQKLAGEEVDLENAKGPELGNYINYGSRLAANNQAMSMGGKGLTNSQVAELREYHKDMLQYDLKEKSYFARMFDVSDVNSVASQAIIRNPNISQPKTMIANFLKKPFGVFDSLKTNLASMITPQAYAQATEPYDYGFRKYGFSVNELQDDKFEDPFANAEVVYPKLEELNEKYGKCFGTTVKDGKLTIEEAPRLDLIEKGLNEDGFDYGNCNDTSELYQRYRFFIIDTMTEHSLACYEGEDSSCSQIGFTEAGGSTDSSSSTTTPSNGALPSGSAQELAKQLLATGKVKGAAQYMAQIQAVADGDNSCNVNPTILGLLLVAAGEFEIYITSLNRFCTGVLTASGAASYHYKDGGGHAVDIGMVNGVASTGRSENDVALLKKIMPLMPQGSGIGQVNCPGEKLQLPAGVTEFNDSCNHIHFQVPVK